MEGKIIAMCFDTTASNTGLKKGACVALENKLGKKLLYLACRHHINEIIISDVFQKCSGASSGPEIGIFKRFKNFWKNVDKSVYETRSSISPWKEQYYLSV